MKVFAVYMIWFEFTELAGVFSSAEKANEAIKLYKKQHPSHTYKVVEFTLDEV